MSSYVESLDISDTEQANIYLTVFNQVVRSEEEFLNQKDQISAHLENQVRERIETWRSRVEEVKKEWPNAESPVNQLPQR